MPAMQRDRIDICRRGMLSWLRGLWCEQAVQPQTERGGLTIALRASLLARRGRVAGGAVCVLYALHLLRAGHWLIGGLVLAGLSATILLARVMAQRQRARPARLLLAADGRIHLLDTRGDIHAVQVAPASLRLGRWLLLLLDDAPVNGACGRARTQLMLGPDNVEPAALATLHRRLASPAQRKTPPELSGGVLDRDRTDR